MPRLIDAEHLKKRATDLLGDCWDNYAQSTEDFLEYIDNEPIVDAVEVVRCENCQYRGSTAECLEHDANWFCADGKRREDGNN